MCPTFRLNAYGSSRSLENRGHPLSPADAHGLEGQTPAAATQLVQHRGHDAHPRRTDGVTERDPRTVDVEPVVAVPIPLAQDGQHLAREGLVDLYEVEIVEGHGAVSEHFGDCGHRPDAHACRVAAGGGPRLEVTDRLQIELFEAVLRHDKTSGGRVVLLAGVASGNGAVRNDCPEAGQDLTRGVGTDAFVAVDEHRGS